MNETAFLDYFKWIAMAVVPASALWGLLGKKPVQEDEGGRKRLTRAGIVTVALITLSAMISAMSFRYETQVRERRSAEEKAEKKQAENDRRLDRATAAVTYANSRTILVEQRVRTAEDRAERADQRSMMIATAVEARQRNFTLVRRVSEGAARNLQRTSEALLQIERVQQPLETLNVQVVWAIAPNAPGLARVMQEARTRFRAEADAAKARAAGNPYLSGDPPNGLRLDSDDPSFPKLDEKDAEQTALRAVITDYGARLLFSKRPLPAQQVDRELNRLITSHWNNQDLQISVYRNDDRQPSVTYLADGSVEFGVQGTFTLDALRKSRDIISYTDLENCVGYIQFDENYAPQTLDKYVKIKWIEIYSNSRDYIINGSRMRQMRITPVHDRRRALFLLPKLASAKYIRN